MSNTQNFNLPPEVQAILRRKSSRDPASQFTPKLHTLLTLSTESPQREDELGLGWLGNNEFRMNKKLVGEIMGIKINTLNVNLKNLGFKQTQRDKDGWTHWQKADFTKDNCGISSMDDQQKQKRCKSQIGASNLTYSGRIGPDIPIREQIETSFRNECKKVWCSLFSVNKESYPVNDFIPAAARILKQERQPQNNAESVLKAIIHPRQDSNGFVTFQDFCRFLAMFGPPKSSMLKIASLLEHSNNTGNWLTFLPETQQPNTFYGAFDPITPNCLVLHKKNGTEIKIYNKPQIEADGTCYLVDSMGREYSNWTEFFNMNPDAIEQEQENYPPMSFQQGYNGY